MQDITDNTHIMILNKQELPKIHFLMSEIILAPQFIKIRRQTEDYIIQKRKHDVKRSNSINNNQNIKSDKLWEITQKYMF